MIDHKTFSCLSHYVSARRTGRAYGPAIRKLITAIRQKYLDSQTGY